MAEEVFRTSGRKRVQLPGGGTVDVPVIKVIAFIDPVDRYQETQHTIDNSGAGDRDVHVANVPGDGAATDETGNQTDGLQVERLDVWRYQDAVDRGQETFVSFDNKTVSEPPDAPPFFTNHTKTHVVRYINTPDNGSWIDSELIDQFSIIDAVGRYQEFQYQLLNPPDNPPIEDGIVMGTDPDTGKTTIAIDPNSFSDISDSQNGIDPPWRLDPFQNIVDFSAAKPFFNIFMSGISHWASTGAPSDTGVPTQNPDGSANPPPGAPLVVPIPYAFNNTWLADFSYTTISSGVLHNQGFGAGPSVSGDRSVSKGMLQYVGTGINGGFFNTPDTSGVGGNASPQATISGPPLVVGGNVIAGFVGTLSFTVTVYAIQTNEVSGDSALIWPNGTSHTWLSYHGGNYVNSPSTTVAIDTFTITVSSSPFRFTAGTFTGMFKAVGLSDNGGQVWTGGSLSVYCIFIGP